MIGNQQNKDDNHCDHIKDISEAKVHDNQTLSDQMSRIEDFFEVE